MAKKYTSSGVRRFDDGSSGDDGLDYIDTGDQNYYTGDTGQVALNSDESPSTNMQMSNAQAAAANLPGVNADGTGNVSLSYAGGDSDGSTSAKSSAASSGIGALLKALGLGGGNTSNTAALGALTGLLSAAGTAKQNAAAGKLPTLPVLPGNTSAGYGPSGGYGFSNYAGSTAPGASTAGLGYAPVTQTAPKPAASYYTYGQGPQQQQFQQVTGGAPITPITSMKRGGHVKKFAMGGMNNTGVQPFAAAPQPVATPQVAPQPTQIPQGAPSMQQPSTGATAMPQRPAMPTMPQRPAAGPTAPQPQSFMAQRMAQARGPVPTPQVAPQQPQQQPLRPQVGLQPQGARAMAGGGFVNPQANPTPSPAIGMAQSQLMGSQPNHALAAIHRGPAAPGRSPGFAMAKGGALSQPGVEGPGVSRHIQGPGDGTSDSIPARLANGEYVIDAQAVSMLGNGDNSAGAKRLDEFRKNLRQHKGGALSKGKMAPDAKPVEQYMGGK